MAAGRRGILPLNHLPGLADTCAQAPPALSRERPSQQHPHPSYAISQQNGEARGGGIFRSGQRHFPIQHPSFHLQKNLFEKTVPDFEPSMPPAALNQLQQAESRHWGSPGGRATRQEDTACAAPGVHSFVSNQRE